MSVVLGLGSYFVFFSSDFSLSLFLCSFFPKIRTAAAVGRLLHPQPTTSTHSAVTVLTGCGQCVVAMLSEVLQLPSGKSERSKMNDLTKVRGVANISCCFNCYFCSGTFPVGTDLWEKAVNEE